jgi:radical SAM superfamily enzyme YgiQ (UPF0313 family)
MNAVILDALAANEGRRKFSRDAIGAGPRLLAGIFEKHKKDIKIQRIEDFLEEEATGSKDNDLFLISAMSVDKIAVQKAVKRIRKNNPTSMIIIGGPILSERIIYKEISFDIGVIGEGERILEQLIKFDFDLDNFQEQEHSSNFIIDKINNTLLCHSAKPTSFNIFDNYIPSTSLISNYPDFWFSKVYVELVRGCSNHYRGDLVRNAGGCSECGECDDPDMITTGDCPEDIPAGCGFCSVSSIFGPPRSKKIELVADEVEQLFDQGVRRIVLSAPGFLDYFRGGENQSIFSPTKPSVNYDKIEKLLQTLSEIRDKQKQICSISVENVKPSLVTEKVSKLIGDYLPQTSISIGCETFDISHSNIIGRPSEPNSALEAAKLFSNHGIFPQVYLIHSLPGETVKSLEITKEIVENQLYEYAEKITVYKYLSLPGSPFTVANVELPRKRHLLDIRREELKESIIEFNLEKKKEMIGKKMITIIAEKDKIRENTYIGYPIFSGPAISIYSEEQILGKTISLEIIGALSDKLLEGKVL